MCYSGVCKFENYMGDCTVGNGVVFRERYGYDCCTVGEFPTGPEDAEFIETHQKELSAIYKQYQRDQEEQRKHLEDSLKSEEKTYDTKRTID